MGGVTLRRWWYGFNPQESGGGLLRLADTENAAQERKFKGGSWSICQKMAAELGTRVVLNSPVRNIRHGEDGECVRRGTCSRWHGTDAPPRRAVMMSGVVITTRDGSWYNADYVIVAMAPAMYGKLEWSPPLPPARAQLCQRMPMGSIIKTITFYETAWWRTAGFSGSFLSDEGPVL